MNSKFVFVTAGSENYLPGLIAFFNSLIANSHNDDVILCSFRLPEKFLKKLEELPYQVRVIAMEGNDQAQETAISRFKIAAELGKDYDSICLVEGDIFLTANVNTFFEAGKRGMIITGSNGMIVNLNKGYQQQYNIDLGTDYFPYPKVHTTVPIFLGKDDLDWFEKFYNGRMNTRSFDDVFGLNALGIKMGKSERMICLPPTTFTQIHHFGIKPVTHLMKKENMILDGFEQQVYMVHGKYFDKGWYTGLMDPMWGFFRDNGFLEKRHEEIALQTRDILMKEFLRYCYNPQFTLKEFQTIEWLEEKANELGIPIIFNS